MARSLVLFLTAARPAETMGLLSTTECTYLPTYPPTQGQLSKTASWMELTEAWHAQEALGHIQESEDPPQTQCEEAALILVLTLHSWTW